MMDYNILTPLQYIILTLCNKDTKTGKELRSILKEMSLPLFYQVMSRLENNKYVKGEYFSVEIGRQRKRERRYTITKLGRKELQRTIDFYKYWEKI